VQGGGFVVGEACCGRAAFDRAFRREMARAFPNGKLAALADTHPVYNVPDPIDRFGYSAALTMQLKDKDGPRLEGIRLGDSTPVIYSRYGLSCGWQEAMPPYSLAYDAETALRLGVGILTYGISH